MSQIKFKDKRTGLYVQGGWDRPLRFFHLTVFDKDEVVWSELSHFDFAQLITPEPLLPILATLGIDTPNGFWELIEKKEGNVIYILSGDEWIKL